MSLYGPMFLDSKIKLTSYVSYKVKVKRKGGRAEEMHKKRQRERVQKRDQKWTKGKKERKKEREHKKYIERDKIGKEKESKEIERAGKKNYYLIILGAV